MIGSVVEELGHGTWPVKMPHSILQFCPSLFFFLIIIFLICCTLPLQLHETSHFYIILDLFLLTFNYKTSIKRLNTHKKRSQCVPDAETSSRDWKRNTRCLCQTNEATFAHKGPKGWSCRLTLCLKSAIMKAKLERSEMAILIRQ